MPDVLTLLEADHRQVETLLDQLGSTDPGPQREELASKVAKALELHMEFEERELYPLLQQIDAEMDEEAEVEHMLVRDGLAKLKAMTAQPGFGAVVDMLKGGISHHVSDEEDEAFPKLRTSVDAAQLAELGAQLMRRKADAGTLADDLAMAPKDDLMAMAQDAEIEGRSSMTADELRASLLR